MLPASPSPEVAAIIAAPLVIVSKLASKLTSPPLPVAPASTVLKIAASSRETASLTWIRKLPASPAPIVEAKI